MQESQVGRIVRVLSLVGAGFGLLTACADMAPSYEGGGWYSSAPPSSQDAGSSQGDAAMAADAGPIADAAEADASHDDAGAVEPERAWFQLSPDDSTSMASAQLIKAGMSSAGGQILPHEVINYYDPPASLRDVAVLEHQWTTAEGLLVGVDGARLMANEDGVESLELLVHLYAPLVPVAERRPWNIHLCVDVSGSMAGDNIAFARESLQLLVDAMQEGDRLSLTTFDDVGKRVFASLDVFNNLPQIRSAIDALHEGGSTNMMAGLEIAYAEAEAHYDPAFVNRVLLFSDGMANVGDTDLEHFASLTRINNNEGIYLSGVGVGLSYAVDTMDALTDAGKGAHVFLPSRAEVQVIFGQMVRKLIEVAADDLSIEVSLPGSFHLQSFSGEEVSTDPNQRVPNVVLAAGDDMTLLARFLTADAAAFDDVIDLTVRYRPLASAEQKLMQQTLSLSDLVQAPGALLERTRLVDQYAVWAGSPERDAEVAADLSQALHAQEDQDPGIEEMACLVDALRGGGNTLSCSPEIEGYPEGYYCQDGRDCEGYMPGLLGGCAGMPSQAGSLFVMVLLLGLMLRRRRWQVARRTPNAVDFTVPPLAHIQRRSVKLM